MKYVLKPLNKDLTTRALTVLVVDDEMGVRESLRMILKDRYVVLTAKNETEALERLTESNIDIDIVALDIRLGDKNGIDVLKTIKHVAPDVEVFLVTGFPSVETAIRAIRFGAYDYVVKPFDKNVVLEVVRKGVLRQGQSLFEKRLRIRNQRLKTAS